MAICGASCSYILPASYSGGCGIQTRPGGIKRLWFMLCNSNGWDYADPQAWEDAQGASPAEVVSTGLIMGQKAKGSFTKKRISSCSPEGVVGAEKQITFMDYNTDTVTGTPGGCLNYTFWNEILTHASSYRMFYETCDGYVYGPINDFIIEIDEVIEDNNTGSTYFDGTVLWNDIEMACATFVTGGAGIPVI
jgi:hypothetical protein